MSIEYLVASAGEFDFDVEALLEAAQDAFPRVEVNRPAGRRAENVDADVYFPGPPGERRMMVTFLTGGGALSVGGGESLDRIAEFVAWVARTAPVPDDGSVVLIEWAPESVPLRPDITAEELLALAPGRT